MSDDPTPNKPQDAASEEADEEEETCGFCIFMKGGGCKDEFTGWEKCVDQARGKELDFTEGCREQTQALQQCMLDNKEYYAPLLEGQASALSAADDSSEDHSEATALADSMAPSESKQDEAPGDQPAKSDGPEPEQQASEAPQSDPAEKLDSSPESKEADGGSGNDPKPEDKSKGASGGDGPSKAKPDDSSQSAQEASKDNESKSQEDDDAGDEGHDGDTSGGAEPFDIPHAGGEDKTGMPGEPEPEPEEEEGEGEEEEEEPAPPEVKVESTPFDVRFPGTNQARHCYTRYNEYHKCAKQNGEDDEKCNVFRKAYRSICPGEWVERWNEQRETGTWPGRW